MLLQTEADPGPGTGKGARKREQDNNQSPFIRNSPMEAKGAINLLPEVNAIRRTEAEVVASTCPPSHNLQFLHRIDVGGGDYWGFGTHGGTTPGHSG